MSGEQAQDEYGDDASTICAVSIARRVCGPEVAAKLVRDFGGTRVFFPKVVRAKHELSLSLGTENAQAISEECHGVLVYIPLSSRAASVRRNNVLMLTRKGKTVREIARLTASSERCIARDIKMLRELGELTPSNRRSASRNNS